MVQGRPYQLSDSSLNSTVGASQIRVNQFLRARWIFKIFICNIDVEARACGYLRG